MSAPKNLPTAPRTVLLGFVIVSMVAMSGVAHAGGIGAFNATGFHVGQALGEQQEQGRWLNEGGGIEVVLGDRDARLNGRLRFAYNAVINLDGGVRHTGLMSIGATIGLLPDLTQKFGLYLAADVAVSPLVQDMQLYFFADIGPGVRVNVADRLTIFAELCGLFRYDTSFSGGLLLTLGVRFPFE